MDTVNIKRLEDEHNKIRDKIFVEIARAKSFLYSNTTQLIEEYLIWDIKEQNKLFMQRDLKAYRTWSDKIFDSIHHDLETRKLLIPSKGEKNIKPAQLEQYFLIHKQRALSSMENLKGKVCPATLAKAQELFDYQEHEIFKMKKDHKVSAAYHTKVKALQEEFSALLEKDRRNAIPWWARAFFKIQKWLFNAYIDSRKNSPD